VAIYDVRERASELEEEAKQGARAAPRAAQPPWKDVRREAASVRRSIPQDVRMLQNEPERPSVPPQPTTGSGLSANVYREGNAVQSPPTRLGEPNPATDRSLEQQQAERDAQLRQGAPPSRLERQGAYLDRSDERAEQDRAAAEQGDREAGQRLRDYEAWKDIYGRMSPRDQEREERLQDDFASRQQGMDDYVRDHPGFRVDQNGDLYADNVTPEEGRDMKRLMRERDRAGRRIEQSHRPYVQGRAQGRLGPR